MRDDLVVHVQDDAFAQMCKAIAAKTMRIRIVELSDKKRTIVVNPDFVANARIAVKNLKKRCGR